MAFFQRPFNKNSRCGVLRSSGKPRSRREHDDGSSEPHAVLGPSEKSEKALTASSQFGVLIDWYPMEKEGLHVGLSGGLSMLTVNDYADESTWHGFGAGGSLFVGYDWPLASTLALGVSLVVSSATSSSMKDQESKQTGYTLRPFSTGIAGSLLFF